MYACYGYASDTHRYICTIVKNTYDSNSLELDQKYVMFEFVLSIGVSFKLVGAGRMPSRYAASTTRSCTSSSLFSTPKLGMLSLRPYCSFKSLKNKLVKLAFFDGGDISHSSNADAAQIAHKKGQFMKFLCIRFGNHVDVHATQSLPTGRVPVH